VPVDTAEPWYDERGGVYPPYHVMRALYAASGAPYRVTEISAPRDVQAMAFETSDGIELWVANLLAEPRAAAVEGIDLEGAQIAVLDASTFEAGASGPEGFERGESTYRGGHFTLAIRRRRFRWCLSAGIGTGASAPIVSALVHPKSAGIQRMWVAVAPTSATLTAPGRSMPFGSPKPGRAATALHAV
jgi:hypothetical protein